MKNYKNRSSVSHVIQLIICELQAYNTDVQEGRSSSFVKGWTFIFGFLVIRVENDFWVEWLLLNTTNKRGGGARELTLYWKSTYSAIVWSHRECGGLKYGWFKWSPMGANGELPKHLMPIEVLLHLFAMNHSKNCNKTSFCSDPQHKCVKNLRRSVLVSEFI